MKKLIIEIDCDDNNIENGDIDNIFTFCKDCSLFIEFGKPHSNEKLGDVGIAETFAIDVRQFDVRLEEA